MEVGNRVPERLFAVLCVCTIMLVALILTQDSVKAGRNCTNNLHVVPTKIVRQNPGNTLHLTTGKQHAPRRCQKNGSTT